MWPWNCLISLSYIFIDYKWSESSTIFNAYTKFRKHFLHLCKYNLKTHKTHTFCQQSCGDDDDADEDEELINFKPNSFEFFFYIIVIFFLLFALTKHSTIQFFFFLINLRPSGGWNTALMLVASLLCLWCAYIWICVNVILPMLRHVYRI